MRVLVLADPGLSLDAAISQRVQGEILNQHRYASLVEARATMQFSDRWSDAVHEHFARESFRILDDGSAEWRYFPEGAAQTEAVLEADLWDEIDVQCPTLMMRGAESDIFPARNMQKLSEIIPQAQCVTLADTYHRLSQDAPQQFAQLLDRFVEAL